MIVKRTKEIFNNLLSKQVDGIIFLGGTLTDETVDLIDKSSVPVVVSGTNDETLNLLQLTLTIHKLASKEIAESLIKKGAKNLHL